MNYFERRRVCKDYYRKCRKGRRDRRMKSLRSLFSRSRDDKEEGETCQEPPSQ